MKIEYNDQKSEPSLDAKPEHSRASPAKLERYLRVSSLMPAAFRFALTGIFFLVLFCAWEKCAPREFTASYVIGRMEKEVSLAYADGQLEAKADYEEYFKTLELATLQGVEKYKGTALMVADNYRATYQQAQVYAAALAEMQKNFAQMKMQMMASMSGGDTTIVNIGRLVEVFGTVTGDYQLADQAREVTESVKRQVMDSMDQLMKVMPSVTVNGWNTTVKSPEEIEAALDNVSIVNLKSFEEFSKEMRHE